MMKRGTRIAEGLRHTKAFVAPHQLTWQAGAVCRFAIEDAVYDLKAVNPREKRTTDTRTPRLPVPKSGRTSGSAGRPGRLAWPLPSDITPNRTQYDPAGD